ncbi:uncharacterized protein [Oryza sativa Japonica Group]|uniref:Os08g0167249 protein n=2 Tax=Oryza TaxID=4527 RepID=A0A0P0XCC3_ORYSJ|nr:uncharacterized protein LOC107277531 [Oryza sativa Japonica Group]KAB8107520.1 hypothetical protein EE612_042324 [Oryza sativa]KAF2918268.1 hypothetical protein DAI22_08g045600 [Oryza sativa Japonica Group]BAT03993.1 Os08g0167249 [Oryza sativa Japonica Group]
MARSTTPTPASPSVCRRVRLSSGAGARSPPPPTRQPNGGGLLPSAFRVALPHATAAVVSSSRGGGGLGARSRRRECACSPTTHPGSFRCALHRGAASPSRPSVAAACGGLREDARRSAMANSLVRIAAVEGGDHVRRAVAALIRPSSHHQRRRAAFRPRPSRLSAMSAAAAASSP